MPTGSGDTLPSAIVGGAKLRAKVSVDDPDPRQDDADWHAAGHETRARAGEGDALNAHGELAMSKSWIELVAVVCLRGTASAAVGATTPPDGRLH
jgi:hypothetical protein